MDNNTQDPQSSNPAAEQELAITRLLHARLAKEECLRAGERESVAYRLAEIMVSAKELYTVVLPSLLGTSKESSDSQDSAELDMLEELAGARMHFMHMKDLFEDFDEAFMEAMAEQRKADGLDERLPGPEALED